MKSTRARAESHPFVSDLNVIWDVSGAPPVSGNGQPGDADRPLDDPLGPEAWRALGYDRHSAFADPHLRDPARPELGLADGSPALALGFRPIDLSDVGPRPRGEREEYAPRRTPVAGLSVSIRTVRPMPAPPLAW